MLRGDGRHFLPPYESQMFRGNTLWAKPEDAIRAGQIIGEELIARHENLDEGAGDGPAVRPSATAVLESALQVVNYAALPTERRVNILRGVVEALGDCGILGGEPEWEPMPEPTTPNPPTTE